MIIFSSLVKLKISIHDPTLLTKLQYIHRLHDFKAIWNYGKGRLLAML